MNKKIILSFLIIMIIIIFFTFTSFATETENTDMVESDTTSADTTSDENNVTYRPQSSNVNSSYVTSVSTVSSQYEANLKLNNFLSILLVSIGILLILFSIAILIRIRK